MRRLRHQIVAALLVMGSFPGAPATAGELTYSDVDLGDLMGLLMTGQPKEAVREATRMIDGLWPSDDPDTLHLIGEILTFRCEAQNELGQYTEAKVSCLEAVAIFKEAEKDERPEKWHTEDWHIARALGHLKAAYMAIGDLKSALVAQMEVQRRTKTSTAKPRALVETGDLQLLLGRFREAETSYIESLAAIAELRRDDRRTAPLPYDNLATLYRLEERFALAEITLKEGIADTEETQAVLAERHAKFGLHEDEIRTNNVEIRLFNQELAWTYLHQDRLSEAQDVAEGLLEQYKSEGETWSPSVSDLKVLLGRIEDAKNPGSPAAERHFASAISASRGGGQLPEIYRAFAQAALAQHHLQTRNTLAAEPYARIAVRTLTEWVGWRSHHTARAHYILASILRHQGKDKEALEHAQRAFAARWTFLPRYHSEIGETLTLMAELYDALGNAKNLRGTNILIEDHKAARAEFEIAN